MEKKLIVLLEDDPLLKLTYSEFLTEDPSGYDLVVIENSQNWQGEMARIGRCPAVTMLDLDLENISGFEVLQQMRDPRFPCHDSPIVVVSSDERESAREACLNTGAVAFYAKSKLDLNALPTILESIVNKGKLSV